MTGELIRLYIGVVSTGNLQINWEFVPAHIQERRGIVKGDLEKRHGGDGGMHGRYNWIKKTTQKSGRRDCVGSCVL